MMRGKSVAVVLAAALILAAGILPAFTPDAAAQAISWPQIKTTPVASGLESPVFITHAGDNSGRIFIVEQRGRIRILLNGQLAGTFLDISGRVRSPFSGGGAEEGLLSLAFPPGYTQKGYFYVYYTNLDGDNQLSRFRLSKDANTADPASEQPILLLTHPKDATNHNGGQLAFGPDGYLYLGVGDGGSTPQNGQNTGTLLGKILRVDVEGNSVKPVTSPYIVYLPLVFTGAMPGQTTFSYSIPADNPFVGVSGYRPEIWALGLRNPWRFSFDRQTGDLYIADVGQSSWEEVDFQPAGSIGGQNYGWDIMEGLTCYNPLSNCNTSGLTPPVYVRATHEAGSCALIGGYVYRGTGSPSMQGFYFMGDYCSGIVWGLKQAGGSWQSQQLATTAFKITSFGEDQAGELYLADANGGIYRITASNP